jgi:hypothetical protein
MSCHSSKQHTVQWKADTYFSIFSTNFPTTISITCTENCTNHFDFVSKWQGSPWKLILLLGFRLKNRSVSSAFCISQGSYYIISCSHTWSFFQSSAVSESTPLISSATAVWTMSCILLPSHQNLQTCLLPNEEKVKTIFPEADSVYRNVVSMSLLESIS